MKLATTSSGGVGSPVGGSHSHGAGDRESSRPGPDGWPMQARGSRRAVSALIKICPAHAASSMLTTAVAAGPPITNSRCEPPTTNIWYAALCTPTDIRRTTLRSPTRIRPTSRKMRRISAAAQHARNACSWSPSWS